MPGYTGAEGRRLDRLRLLDLLRACYADGVNQAGAAQARAREQSWVAPEWGWAWPVNRRILYNRASADPDGRPWSERKRYVWWDEEQGALDRPRRARLRGRPRRPTTTRPTAREAERRAARRRAVHHAGRRQGLAVRAQRAWSTGRCRRTTSRTSRRSPTRSTAQQRNPAARRSTTGPDNPLPPAPRPTRVFPYVFTTYRLTEHHTAGGMSRWLAVPGRAAAGDVLRGLARSWPRARPRATAAGRRSSPPRAAIEARVLVTERLRPLRGRRPRRPPGRPALPLGPQRAGDRATRPTTCCRSSATRTSTSRSPRSSPATSGPAAGRAARRWSSWSRATGPGPWPSSAARGADDRRAADGVLHRHLGLHRLQGLRGGLQGVERGPRGRAAAAHRRLLRQHRGARAPTPGATSPSSSSSADDGRGCAG